MIQVTAAIIEQNGKTLICQRPHNKSNPLLWEFPGGKLEKEETPEQCLIRECNEELGISLSIYEKFDETEYAYPGFTVRIAFFKAKILSGIPRCLEHNDIKWVLKDELSNYQFCPADIGTVKKFISE